MEILVTCLLMVTPLLATAAVVTLLLNVLAHALLDTFSTIGCGDCPPEEAVPWR